MSFAEAQRWHAEGGSGVREPEPISHYPVELGDSKVAEWDGEGVYLGIERGEYDDPWIYMDMQESREFFTWLEELIGKIEEREDNV